MTTHDEDKIIAQQARIEQLTNFIRYAQVSSGVCCCGESMEGHPSHMTCGHSPVDMWDYHSGKLLEEAYPDDLSALRAHDEKLRAVFQGIEELERERDTAWAQAHRLALELECLIMDTKDNAVVSKWWDSAFEAIEEYHALKPGAADAEAWSKMRKAGV